MKERPLLMSGEMVRRVLDGSKTQTRRLVGAWADEDVESWPWPCNGGPNAYGEHRAHRAPPAGSFHYHSKNGFNWGEAKPQHGTVGDRLWIRETSAETDLGTWYRADFQRRYGAWEREIDPVVPGGNPHVQRYEGKWTPAIHMPRLRSRLTLEITDVRVQRLQDISEEDARAEGFPLPGPQPSTIVIDGKAHRGTSVFMEPLGAFVAYWNGLAAATDGPDWKANPWVWAITFDVVPKDGGGE